MRLPFPRTGDEDQQPPCVDDPELWFPRGDTPRHYEPAKQLCRTCPLREPCLTYALDKPEPYGVWGGTDPHDRELLNRRRGYVPPAEEATA